MELLGSKSWSFTSGPCAPSCRAVTRVCFVSANTIVATGAEEGLDELSFPSVAWRVKVLNSFLMGRGA